MLDAGTWARLLSLAGIMFGAYLLTMWAAIVIWTHRDIASRTGDRTQRMMAVALVGLFSAPGFLLYLALRPPETAAETLISQLEADALIHDMERQPSCPGCGHAISSEFVACPYCRNTVEASCGSCARNLRTSWVICPYCGHDRPEAAAATRARAPIGWARVPTGAQAPLQPVAGRGVLSSSAKV